MKNGKTNYINNSFDNEIKQDLNKDNNSLIV